MLQLNSRSRHTPLLALSLAVALSTTGLAATRVQNISGSKIDPVSLHRAIASRPISTGATRHAGIVPVGAGKSLPGAGTTAKPAEIYANPNRAYPPSCLNDGLPFGGYNADPNARQMQVALPEYDPGTGQYDLIEYDTFTVWRVPCSGGVSATVLEIDRPNSSNGNATTFPIFPNISATQSGSSSRAYPRLPQDPNTVYSDTEPTSPFIYSSIYVLEYYNGDVSLSDTQIDYNQAFTLSVDNYSGGSSATISVPTYSAANFDYYPSATNPMEISGYMSTTWTNPNQSGEGLFLQVYDAGDQANRILAFAWFTYDNLGLPFWLYGQATFPIGTSSVEVPTDYLQDGSFAPPNLVAPANTKVWGSVRISFPDCAHINLQYNGDASAVNGPSGTGNETFLRVADVNNLVCQ
ncbi:MAG: hypothetical protein WBV39_10160 [Rudaea sp.]